MSRDILLDQIKPDPDQPRKYFDPERLAELAASISEHGLAVPILVRPSGDGYIIVHGERRYKAVQTLGWEAIPAEVRDIPEDQARWLSLIENIQREDLSPIEEGQEYRRILDAGITHAELGERIGKSQSYIAHKMRLINMPEPLRRLVEHKIITEGHARQLLRLDNVYQDVRIDMTGWMDLDINKHNQVELAQMALLAITPLDYMPGPMIFDFIEDQEKVNQLIDLVINFILWIKTKSPNMDAWIRTAFYFGCYTYYHSLSVVDLSKIIDVFIDVFYSALAFTEKDANKPTKESEPKYFELESARYWGRRADLRHAGISLDDCPNSLMIEALNHIGRTQAITEPSTIQWENLHPRVKRQMEKQRAERAEND